MTKEEQRANLDALMERLYKRLSNLSDRELGEGGSSIILNNIGKVGSLIYGLHSEENAHEEPEATLNKTPDEASDAPVAEEPKEEPQKSQGTGNGDDAPQISKAELKKRLIDLTNQYDDLDVAKIMGSMGYDRLSDIPESRYQELMSSVDRAVEALK